MRVVETTRYISPNDISAWLLERDKRFNDITKRGVSHGISRTKESFLYILDHFITQDMARVCAINNSVQISCV